MIGQSLPGRRTGSAARRDGACHLVRGIMLGVLVGLPIGLFADEPHRSPVAVAVRPGTTEALTANSTAGSVSWIDWSSGKVIQELTVGSRPWDVKWINARRAIVALAEADQIALLTWPDSKGEIQRKIIDIGDEPSALAIGPREGIAYVALTGTDEVVELETGTGNVLRRFATGGLPRSVAISPNGNWLITCSNVPGEVTVHDLATGELLSRRKIFDDGFNLGHPAITADSSKLILPHIVNRGFAVTRGNIEIGWVLDNRVTRLPLPAGEKADQQQMGLDIRHDAVGDVHQALLNSDETQLVVSASGTHELLVLRFQDIPWPPGDSGDFAPKELRNAPDRYRRIKLGGRPLGIAWASPTSLLVANGHRDSIQVVDLTNDTVAREIALGGPATPSPARLGEMVFTDADWSLHSWYSCQTCHPGGGTAGQIFDTRNDGGYGLPKLIPPLTGVAQTGPWTWHGWQKDLTAAMKVSLEESMSTTRKITDHEAEVLVAYLETLKPPVSPHRQPDGSLTPLAEAGRELFVGKAACADCHAGDTFTTDDVFRVGLEGPRDRYKGYNPPSLRGLHARRRFLHDGRARSVEEVLREWHKPEELNGAALTDDEREALIAYLKSL